jgi:hypothetical protein
MERSQGSRIRLLRLWLANWWVLIRWCSRVTLMRHYTVALNYACMTARFFLYCAFRLRAHLVTAVTALVGFI